MKTQIPFGVGEAIMLFNFLSDTFGDGRITAWVKASFEDVSQTRWVQRTRVCEA